MSNYPPGVSGNEYEISGPDHEWTDSDFECSNQEFEYVRISEHAYKTIMQTVSGYSMIPHQEKIKDSIYRYLADIYFSILTGPSTEVVTEPCGYVGEVEKQSYKDNIWWECPRCKKEYEDKESNYYGDY